MDNNQKLSNAMVQFYRKVAKVYSPSLTLVQLEILASQYVGPRPDIVECEGIVLQKSKTAERLELMARYYC